MDNDLVKELESNAMLLAELVGSQGYKALKVQLGKTVSSLKERIFAQSRPETHEIDMFKRELFVAELNGLQRFFTGIEQTARTAIEEERKRGG